MAKISMVVPDEDLAAIDEVASPNRTAFIIEAVRDAVVRIQCKRLDAEISSCLEETSNDDLALVAEFSGVSADGL